MGKGVIAVITALVVVAGAAYGIHRGLTAGTAPYLHAIAYTQTRPAFTPARVVDVASASELRSGRESAAG